MKNLFNDISHEERRRILEMHENATKRNYLTEAPTGGTPTQTAGTKTQTGGVTPPQTNTSGGAPDKLTLLKTDEANRDKFTYVNAEDLRRYLGANILKPNPQGEESHDTYMFYQRVITQPLTWYAKTGQTPQKFKLSQIVSYIEKMFPGFADDYAAVTGTPPYQQAKLMKAGPFDKKFEQIYNEQLAKI
jgi:hypothetical protein